LRSLTSADKEFLKGTTINGYLDLSSLTSADKTILKENVKQLKVGYNEQDGYCFFDGILTKVKSVTVKKEITIYTTSIGFVAQKGKFTAHGNTVKKAIQDLEFKIISEKLKKEPIKKDTKFTVNYYRMLTGACDEGVRSFMQSNNISYAILNKGTDKEETILVDENQVECTINAVELFKILEKSKPYGFEKFKQLCKF
jgi:hypothetical protein